MSDRLRALHEATAAWNCPAINVSIPVGPCECGASDVNEYIEALEAKVERLERALRDIRGPGCSWNCKPGGLAPCAACKAEAALEGRGT